MIKFEMKGIKELEKTLKELGKAITRYDLEKVAEVALQPVYDSAVRNVRSVVRDKTGNLSRSITIKRMGIRLRRKYNYFGGMRVTSRAPHAHLIEYGTGARTRENGGVTGRVRARPFLRPAYDAHRNHVFQIASKELGERLQKKVNRAIKNHALRK
jgi:HK97 gp10 family phage protein